MKSFFTTLLCISFSLLGYAQTESTLPKSRYTIIGVNMASVLANQIQLDAEFGRERTTFAWMASVFYGQVGSYENTSGEVFSSAQNFGLGAGVRMYETNTVGTRFFIQPSVYYKSLAVNYEVMQFIPSTYDGLPAQRWGPATQTDEFRGVVGEFLAGSQTFIKSIVIEGSFGFVYRNLSPLQQTQKIYSAGAEMVLGAGDFSPVAQLKIGYKF